MCSWNRDSAFYFTFSISTESDTNVEASRSIVLPKLIFVRIRLFWIASCDIVNSKVKCTSVSMGTHVWVLFLYFIEIIVSVKSQMLDPVSQLARSFSIVFQNPPASRFLLIIFHWLWNVRKQRSSGKLEELSHEDDASCPESPGRVTERELTFYTKPIYHPVAWYSRATPCATPWKMVRFAIDLRMRNDSLPLW